jgi:hypothetical protein
MTLELILQFERLIRLLICRQNFFQDGGARCYMICSSNLILAENTLVLRLFRLEKVDHALVANRSSTLC